MTMGVMTMGVVTVTVVLRGEKSLLGVIPTHVGEGSVLDVASEETLLGERGGVLLRVDSPSHLSAEEQGTVIPLCNLLVQVELEQFLRLRTLHLLFSD